MEQLGFPGLVRFKDDEVDPVNHVRRCYFQVKPEPLSICPHCGYKDKPP